MYPFLMFPWTIVIAEKDRQQRFTVQNYHLKLSLYEDVAPS